MAEHQRRMEMIKSALDDGMVERGATLDGGILRLVNHPEAPSQEAIAQLLGVSKSTVSRRLKRIKGALLAGESIYCEDHEQLTNSIFFRDLFEKLSKKFTGAEIVEGLARRNEARDYFLERAEAENRRCIALINAMEDKLRPTGALKAPDPTDKEFMNKVREWAKENIAQAEYLPKDIALWLGPLGASVSGTYVSAKPAEETSDAESGAEEARNEQE
ncbi:AsnC family protein [Pseudomonas sp. UMAB-08]|uniref:AsnC family protein n=1 Tax=Pseudomonas sp. UMAB-08 TaxID=1365375 RepID=UPI001C566FAF|nr:AsnC family protein [Pseudomonas sp. UMAB-08]